MRKTIVGTHRNCSKTLLYLGFVICHWDVKLYYLVSPIPVSPVFPVVHEYQVKGQGDSA